MTPPAPAYPRCCNMTKQRPKATFDFLFAGATTSSRTPESTLKGGARGQFASCGTDAVNGESRRWHMSTRNALNVLGN